MKNTFALSRLFALFLGACQSQSAVTEAIPATVASVTPALIPSSTPEPEPTVTSTAVPLSFPLGAGIALPADFVAEQFNLQNLSTLQEIIRIGQQETIVFDAKYWDGMWLLDTNKGVQLVKESGELLAELGASQQRCAKDNQINQARYMPSQMYSNIYISENGIGVIGFDGAHIYTPDGQQQTALIPFDAQYLQAYPFPCVVPVFGAAISPDMKWVAVNKPTISYTTTEIISVESGENVASLSGESVRAFSPDGQYLLVQTGEERFLLYQTINWSQLTQMRIPDYVRAAGFSPNSDFLVFRRANDAVVMRPTDANKVVTVSGHTILFHKLTNEIGALTWEDEVNIHVWDFEQGGEVRIEKFNPDEWQQPVTPVPTIPDLKIKDYTGARNLGFSCSFIEDQFQCFAYPSICRYDLNGKNACAPAETQADATKQVNGMKYDLYEQRGMYMRSFPTWAGMSADKKYFVYFTDETSAATRVIEYALHFMMGETEVASMKLNRSVDKALISHDGKYLLAVVDTRGDQVLLFDLETGKVLKELVKFNDSDRGSRGLAFSADDHFAAYVDVEPGNKQGKLSVYDISLDKEVMAVDVDLRLGNINALAFSPDATMIATGAFDGKISIYDVTSTQLLHSWYAHNGFITDLEFSPDGKWLLSAGGLDETVKLWTPLQ